jgi:hypothetical protein
MHYGQLRKRARIIEAHRSGLEKKIAAQLEEEGVEYAYEGYTMKYMKPAKWTTYTPDFALPNGIFVETKGFFESKDRTKHLLIKEQYPGLDIRFVFSRPSQPISKGSKTTYADWCDKHGFQYAAKLIPQEWLEECRDTLLGPASSADIKQKTGKPTNPTSQTSPSTKRKTRKSGQVSTTTTEKSSTTT